MNKAIHTFGIVGCGRIAPKHIESILNIGEAKLVAICDNDSHKTEAYRKVYKGVEYYHQYEEMLMNPRIDIINICTPSGLHYEQAKKAMLAGKHVIIEKPIALSVEEAEELIVISKKMNVKGTVVHQNRYNSAVQSLRKVLDEGKFGTLSHGVASIRWNRNQEYYNQASWRGTKSMKDGFLMNQSIHNIDLLLWMMGPVKKVMGHVATRLRDIEMEDVGGAILEFQSGALGIIEAAGTVYPTNLEETLSIFGSKGTVCLGGIAVNKIESWRFSEDFLMEEETHVNNIWDNPENVYGFGHQNTMKDMINCIQLNQQPYVTLADGKRAIEVILAIYESARNNQVIYLNQ